MTITMHNPEAPATNKQLWLLHILTKTDTRNLNITMAEASKRIAELKSGSKRPLVNPHATAIRQDKQKLTQARYDKDNPKPEREVIQGNKPSGETDMQKIQAHFMANAYQAGRDKAENDTATIDFYDFQCKDCLFGKTGVCEPDWREASFTTGGGVTEPLRVESVSFDCQHHEPVKYSITEYCHRPKGKQCHRKHIDNKCLECAYRNKGFRDGYNHSAWGNYIPTIAERIKSQEYWLAEFTKSGNTTGLEQTNAIIRLLNTLQGA